MTTTQTAAALVFVVAAFGLMGHLDEQDAKMHQAHYCDMVSAWESDAARGIPAADRAGWPPFDGGCEK